MKSALLFVWMARTRVKAAIASVVGFASGWKRSPVEKPGRVVGRELSLRSMRARALVNRPGQINLHGGVEQMSSSGWRAISVSSRLGAPRQIVFLEISGGGDDVQLGRIGFGEGKFFRLLERVAQRFERAVGQAGHR